MKTSFKHYLSIGTAALALTAALHIAAPVSAAAEEATAKVVSMPKAPSRAELLVIREGDNVLGAEDAPVTMIEYASMSCSHCATFHKETFPKLKENYIDTGKLRFVLRDFPLNRPAVLGATMARCAPEDKYYKYVSALFSEQGEWLSGDAEQKLKAIATMGGMSEDEFYACIKNKEISDDIVLKSRYEAVKSLSIRSTPTFFIDGITYEGAKDYKFFAGAIDKLIKQAEKKDAKTAPKKTEAKDIESEDVKPTGEEATNIEAKEESKAEPSLTEKIVNKVKATATDIKNTLKDGVPAKEGDVKAVAPAAAVLTGGATAVEAAKDNAAKAAVASDIATDAAEIAEEAAGKAEEAADNAEDVAEEAAENAQEAAEEAEDAVTEKE